ncbi:Hypothetical protein ETEE_3572 [Edwardsiella anguillarum ET080813]|uniref:Uncharacterized protein n=1 Tax=Edwardsiella anguillarum ET080813 TaxID=667120 RepID=A0A076LTI7_9GAMM|nr:Hypothetical protein ETEE_3572 [Edwardsiella anguillarum ET080813]
MSSWLTTGTNISGTWPGWQGGIITFFPEIHTIADRVRSAVKKAAPSRRSCGYFSRSACGAL